MPGVVVGFDGSANAAYALGWAMRQAVLEHAVLTVLAVNEVAVSPWTGDPCVMPQDTVMLEQVRQAADDAVAKALIGFSEAERPSVSVVAMSGFPAQELINASHDADLMVVGSRGQLDFPMLRLGAISIKVAHFASCPVVIVPPVS
jgi:nucleotide-binding universal stress UspA family protein